MKRILDLIFGLILFFILLPFLLIISLLIKLSSKGPIVFMQKRTGQHGREFSIYKFRTMYTDAPSNKATHLLENPEKYITPVGRVLRKTSLDELPQLFNVLKGEMSFVGPRPSLYNQFDLIELREKNGVHKVKPGITGWAQVNGRDELLIPDKVEYDKYYVDNLSVWFDIKIICLTAKNVLIHKGVVEGSQTSEQKQIKM